MIDETTLLKIENQARAMHPHTDIGDNVRLLVAEIREMKQAPNRDEMFMTKDEWIGLSDESRLKLTRWVHEINESAKLLASAGDDIEERQSKLDRLYAMCQSYPLQVFPEPDLTLARQALSSAGISLDAVSATVARGVLERVLKIVTEGEDRGEFRFLNQTKGEDKP
jgi:hypothetical protein